MEAIEAFKAANTVSQPVSLWVKIINAAEIAAYHAMTAKIDPRFAKSEAAFYASCTANRLRVLIAQAWDCNDSTAYMVARSYLAQLEG